MDRAHAALRLAAHNPQRSAARRALNYSHSEYADSPVMIRSPFGAATALDNTLNHSAGDQIEQNASAPRLRSVPGTNANNAQPSQIPWPHEPPVEATTRCNLPTYWNFNPELWFAQVESAFEVNGIRADKSKYNLVISQLPQDIAQEVADIILHPPLTDRYPALRNAVLQRLAASADTRLHQLLNEVRLDSKTPSQLLRHMKRLANGAISDEALKVKWLDLLPPYTSRLCRVLPATSLDELAQLADLAMPTDTPVHAVSPQHAFVNDVSHRPALSQPNSELAALKLSLTQLIGVTQRQTALLEQLVNGQNRGSQDGRRDNARPRARSSSRPRSGQPSNATTPTTGDDGTCWYHWRFGRQATRCRPPCTYDQRQGN